MIWALLLGAVPLDTVGAPLPLYMTLDDVMAYLRRAEAQLVTCIPKTDETIALSMNFHPDGQVRMDPAAETLSNVEQCVRHAIEALPGPVHHDGPVKVSSTVYFRGGQTIMSPSPSMDVRYLGPLMLFVDDGQVGRDVIIQHLSGADRKQ